MKSKQNQFGRRLQQRVRGWHIPTAVLAFQGFLALTFSAAAGNAPDILWTQVAHSSRVNAVAFSPNGQFVASGGGDGLVNLWRISNGMLVRTFNSDTPPSSENRILAVSFSPDGTRLAAGGHGEIRIWTVSNGALVGHIEDAHSDWILSVAYSKDGSVLASGSFDTTARIWNAEDWGLLHTLTHDAQVRSVAFAPNNLALAVGTGDSTIHLWHTVTGNSIRVIQGSVGPGQGSEVDILSVSFSPDGSVLTAGSQDRTVKTWNPSTGQRLYTALGHSHFVYSVAYSYDGKLLLSAAGDDTLRIWDTAKGELVRTYTAETSGITTVSCFDQDLFAFGTANGIVRLARMHSLLMKPEFLATPGDVRLRFHGETGKSYELQQSNDLTDWSPITSDTLTERPLVFQVNTDPAAACYFRVLELPEE